MKIWPTSSQWLARGARERIESLAPDQINSIAVIKHGALGDMLLTRPMFHTLRKNFPNAKLTLSAISHYLNGIPEDLVDRVHVVPGKGSNSGIRENYRAFKELGYHDFIFDITASTRSFWITRLNDALLKVGFKHRNTHRFIYDLAIDRAHLRFEAETFLEQVNTLGIAHEWPLRFDLPVRKISRNAPYIIYFPTASVSSKCWPAERYAALMKQMSAAHPQFEHLLLVGVADWEKEVGHRITEEVKHLGNVAVVNGGKDTFDLVAGARLLISNDTGIRNLAITTDTPSIGIFGHLPFGYMPRFGDHQVVFHYDGRVPDVSDVAAVMERSLAANPHAREKAA